MCSERWEPRMFVHMRRSLWNQRGDGKKNDNCFLDLLFVCLSLWPILICHLVYYWGADYKNSRCFISLVSLKLPHTLKCCSYSCTLLSISVVGIFLKVCGTSVLPLFIHAPEPLKRAKMLPTHYKTPATHGLALWCHQSGFKGSFSTINQSLVSEDPARENIWTSCAETFEKLRRCCICNSGVSCPEDVCVCVCV